MLGRDNRVDCYLHLDGRVAFWNPVERLSGELSCDDCTKETTTYETKCVTGDHRYFCAVPEASRYTTQASQQTSQTETAQLYYG